MPSANNVPPTISDFCGCTRRLPSLEGGSMHEHKSLSLSLCGPSKLQLTPNLGGELM